MNEITNYWTETIEKVSGKQIMVDTIDCITHKMEHANCLECPHYLQCAKLAAVLQIQSEVSIYKPLDFLDQLKMKKQATTAIESVINAESIKEVRKVI